MVKTLSHDMLKEKEEKETRPVSLLPRLAYSITAKCATPSRAFWHVCIGFLKFPANQRTVHRKYNFRTSFCWFSASYKPHSHTTLSARDYFDYPAYIDWLLIG